jgi:Ca2+-binding EF-hand superfamily protein
VTKARAVFDMFDVDGSGEIEASELSQIITQLTGVTPTETALQQMLE